MPREKFLPDVVVVCNKKGWMNSDVMKIWVDKCFKARPGGFFSAKSLLIADAMTAHKDQNVQSHLNQNGAHIAIIPGGLTSKLQPLDIAVNKPFKQFIRQEWDKWMQSGEHDFTPSGRLKRASYSEVCKWVALAWEKITPNTICNGFKKAGICYQNNETDSATSETGEADKDDDYHFSSKLEKKRLLAAQKHDELSDNTSEFNGFEVLDDDDEKPATL